MTTKLAQVSREIISLRNFIRNKKRYEHIDFYDKLSKSIYMLQ